MSCLIYSPERTLAQSTSTNPACDTQLHKHQFQDFPWHFLIHISTTYSTYKSFWYFIKLVHISTFLFHCTCLVSQGSHYSWITPGIWKFSSRALENSLKILFFPPTPGKLLEFYKHIRWMEHGTATDQWRTRDQEKANEIATLTFFHAHLVGHLL